MGYYTMHEFWLEGNDNEDQYEEHKKNIEELSGYGSSLFEEPVKWYDCSEDMIKYSKLHPDVVFAIYCEGEDAGDMWKQYFKNGKEQMCKAKIEFDEYDESKLTDL